MDWSRKTEQQLFYQNNIAQGGEESTPRAKNVGIFSAPAVRVLPADAAKESETAAQNETLMSPEIAVGWGMSFIPMEFSQS